MNKYTRYILIFATLTALSIIGSAYLNPPYQHLGTAGVVVFWIMGLGSFFLRGYDWYKKDLLKRAKNVKEDVEEEDEDSEQKSEIERLFN